MNWKYDTVQSITEGDSAEGSDLESVPLALPGIFSHNLGSATWGSYSTSPTLRWK